MKKMFGLFFFIGLFFWGSLVFSQQESLNALNMDFCDSLKKEQLSGNTLLAFPGSGKDICVEFTNSSNKDIYVLFDFSKKLLNNVGDFTCGPASLGNPFASSIKNYDSGFLLPAQSKIQKIFRFLAPLNVSGMLHGCIVYSAQDSNYNSGMFKMVFQKSKFLDIYVVGDVKINKSFEITKPDFFLDGDQFFGKIVVTNKGNVNQLLTLTGEIENVMGYNKMFEFAKDNLFLPEETKTLNISLGKIPFYKGLYSYKLYGIHTPQFDFDASILGEDALESIQFYDSGYVFFFSWIILCVVLFVILFIIIFFRSLFKKKNLVNNN